MTTRDDKTPPGPAPDADTWVDPEPPDAVAGRQDSDDGLSSLSATTPRYRSEPEPIDVTLRKLARARPLVPNSLEEGTRYEATHDPARAEVGQAAPERLVAVALPSTDPAAPRALRRRSHRPHGPSSARRLVLWTGAALGIVALIFLAATVWRLAPDAMHPTTTGLVAPAPRATGPAPSARIAPIAEIQSSASVAAAAASEGRPAPSPESSIAPKPSPPRASSPPQARSASRISKPLVQSVPTAGDDDDLKPYIP